jgi:hypothetical protein
MQAPLHAALQHTPPTQFPDRHSVVATQVWPFAFLHPPCPSHASAPTHAPSCSPIVTFWHVPVTHVLQSAPHAASQHRLSKHWPERHSLPALHAWPFTPLQWLLPSHA